VPYVRDDRETPLCVGRDGERYVGDLGQKGTEEFLQKGLDTPPIGKLGDLPVEAGQERRDQPSKTGWRLGAAIC
jgi:hypothetical protein